MMSRIVFFALLPAIALAQNFEAQSDTSVLALASDSLRQDFRSALIDAGTNWHELADAVQQAGPQYRTEAVWLILQMPHLDRLEMTSAILLEHIDYAHRTLSAFRYPVPESLFQNYILTYRIADEPVTAWRRLLFDRFAPMTQSATTPEQAARLINQWLARNLKTIEKGFFGPMKSPELALDSRNGTIEEIAVLATAILKTLGIPSRRVKVPWLGEQDGDASWVEVYSQGRWLPLYPLESKAFGDTSWVERQHPHNVTIAVATSAFDQNLVTEHYTGSGRVKLHLSSAGIPLSRFENFSFNTFNYGAWRPLDELNTITDSFGNYECVLGDGDYLLTFGVRDPDGNPWIVNRGFSVKPGDSVRLSPDLSPQVARMPHPALDDPLLQHDYPNLNGGISSASELRGRVGFVIFFNPGDSAALRSAMFAESLYQSFKDKGFAVLGIGLDGAYEVRQFRTAGKLSFDVAFFPSDVQRSFLPTSIAPLLGLPYVVPMPCLKLVGKDGIVVSTEFEPDPARLAALGQQVAGLLK
jgi:peroxiredoxin